MTNEEAKKTCCPLDNHPESSGNCLGDLCNWWLEAEPDCGECAIRRAARMLTEPMILSEKSWSGPDIRQRTDD